MKPRERVEAALLGREHDFVPFTVPIQFLPTSETERHLRNDGLCVLDSQARFYTTHYHEVSIERTSFTGADGQEHVRIRVETPAGSLAALDRPAGFTTWHEERLWKTPADFDALEAMIRDRSYAPAYDEFAARQAMMGGDCLAWANMWYSPLMEIIVNLLGVEQFAVQWAENRERVLRLYNALVDDRRKLYSIAAASPALLVQYCGNVTPEVVGLERFERYILPHYDEAAELLHAHGKLMCVHFDANLKLLAPAIARSRVDVIDAFTPQPTCDMTVAEARAVWPDKVLWVNFPSSVHLESAEVVEETARRILREGAPGDRLLMGITEDVPADRWAGNFAAILRACRKHGRLPIRA